MQDSEGDQMPPANPTGSTETRDTHACLPGEPARESPLLKAKVRDTETGTKELGGQGHVSSKGEDKHKRRETKSKMGETVCPWFFTISHFLAKSKPCFRKHRNCVFTKSPSRETK